jgi:hypothetical protein
VAKLIRYDRDGQPKVIRRSIFRKLKCSGPEYRKEEEKRSFKI